MRAAVGLDIVEKRLKEQGSSETSERLKSSVQPSGPASESIVRD
jgi:hypothetical protein